MAVVCFGKPIATLHGDIMPSGGHGGDYANGSVVELIQGYDVLKLMEFGIH